MSLSAQLNSCLLRVEEHEGDENNDDDEELQETHPDEQIPQNIDSTKTLLSQESLDESLQ